MTSVSIDVALESTVLTLSECSSVKCRVSSIPNVEHQVSSVERSNIEHQAPRSSVELSSISVELVGPSTIEHQVPRSSVKHQASVRVDCREDRRGGGME